MNRVYFFVCLLCLISFTCAATKDLTVEEPVTKTIFESTYDGCQMTSIGQIKYWLLKWVVAASAAFYECSPETLEEESAKLEIFRTYIFNWEVQAGFTKLIATKDAAGLFIIPIAQQNIITGLLSNLSGGLWKSQVLRFTWKSGTFTLLKGTNVLGSSTLLTRTSYDKLIGILKSGIFEETMKR